MLFNELSIVAPILKALESKGYKQPTPIQEQTIPAILSGRDVLAGAQTGTGKTAAYSIPLLQRLSEKPSNRAIRALVLAPTRELAVQVGENVTRYGSNLKISNTLVYGGVSQVNQVKDIRRGVDVVIATPGRLMDLIRQRVIALDKLEILVLDEADRMLDMGFIADVKRIMQMVPQGCQRIFLSATMPDAIQKLVASMLRNPIRISIATPQNQIKIQQGIYYVSRQDKRALLRHVIDERKMKNVLVFARTKRGADKIALDLTKQGISAEAFHSNKSQGARQKALSNFKRNATRVLVATDIAARGIDIIDLPFVINYEMPDTMETYTHRIGRTGRAGNSGVALSFCDHDEQDQLRSLHRSPAGRLEVLKHPFAAQQERRQYFN